MEELEIIQKALDKLKARLAAGISSPRPTCSTCRWYGLWRDGEGKYADCRKNAPVKIRKYRGRNVAEWPMVADYDFCKEWESPNIPMTVKTHSGGK